MGLSAAEFAISLESVVRAGTGLVEVTTGWISSDGSLLTDLSERLHC